MKKSGEPKGPQFIRERNENTNSQTEIADRRINRLHAGFLLMDKRTKYLAVLLGTVFILTIIVLFASRGNNSNDSLNGSSFLSSYVASKATSKIANSNGSASPAVSPVITYTPAQKAAFEALKVNVFRQVYKFDGRIGVYYINLNTGQAWGINEKEPFVAASSIKMSIATELYKRVAKGDFKLTDTIKYDSRPYPAGDMAPDIGEVKKNPNGTLFSVRRVAQLAITISDNTATNMMIKKLGGIDSVAIQLNKISYAVPYRTPVAYIDYKGARIFERHRTSAIDLALYAQNLYSLWQAFKKDYQPLIDDLEGTVFDFGIPQNLPKGIEVAHNIGSNSQYKTENDVGIVFAGDPFVICVTTEGNDQAAGRKAIAEISAIFYNYVSK